MTATSKSVLLAAFLGVSLTTTLAAMVTDTPSVAASKEDRLVVPVTNDSPGVVVENLGSNVSIVTRPAS